MMSPLLPHSSYSYQMQQYRDDHAMTPAMPAQSFPAVSLTTTPAPAPSMYAHGPLPEPSPTQRHKARKLKISVPQPVPNLTKASRGRPVPTLLDLQHGGLWEGDNSRTRVKSARRTNMEPMIVQSADADDGINAVLRTVQWTTPGASGVKEEDDIEEEDFEDDMPLHSAVTMRPFSTPTTSSSSSSLAYPLSATQQQHPEVLHRRMSAPTLVAPAGPTPRGISPRVFVCEVQECRKAFKRKEHLRRHTRSIHTHEKRTLVVSSAACILIEHIFQHTRARNRTARKSSAEATICGRCVSHVCFSSVRLLMNASPSPSHCHVEFQPSQHDIASTFEFQSTSMQRPTSLHSSLQVAGGGRRQP